MKHLRISLGSLLLVVLLNVHAYPELIDFEGLGLADGNPIGTIGVAQFDASVSIQGSGYAFISHPYGNGTGDAPPFSGTGNTFITNPGGLGAAQTVKTITVDFAVPVSNLSFYACDIDSAEAIETLTATVFDSTGTALGDFVHTAPTGSENGDGEVVPVNFGNIGGIRRLQISLGSQGSYTSIGFGIDNLAFDIEPLYTVDTTPPFGSVHAYPNLLWPPNKSLKPVTISGYVKDEMCSAADGGGTGVSSAYLLINGYYQIDLILNENGQYSVEIELPAFGGSVFGVELYAADTLLNQGLVDTTFITCPNNMQEGSR